MCCVMDKRYYLIIFIICFCLLSMFFISNNSVEIGTASVNLGNYIFSIPNNFNLMNTYDTRVVLNNPNNDLNLAVYSYDSNYSKNFTNKVNDVKNSTDSKVLSEGDIHVGDITVKSFYYSDYGTDGKLLNRSMYYFEKFNNSYKIEMNTFDYDKDGNYTISVVEVIVDTLRINYKK